MRGWGIEERGQSNVSAYSRAKERIVTKRGEELHPENVSVLCLLSRDDVGQEVAPREEPATTEDVEDVKHR